MNISTMQLTDNKMISENTSLMQNLLNFVTAYSEYFWFSISFVLFLLLGPFSIIAVVIGLWNLSSGEHVKEMTEPAKR